MTQRVVAPSLAVGLLVVACGPTLVAEEDPSAWALGTWSSRTPDLGTGSTTSNIRHFAVSEDGTSRITALECGSGEVSLVAQYDWVTADVDAIELVVPDGEDPTFVVLRTACEQFEGRERAYVVHALDGRELFTAEEAWVRGEVCLGELEPWGGCRLHFCDAEPPPPWPCE